MPLDPIDPRTFSLSPEQRAADKFASAARQIGALQRNSLLLSTVARAAGGFDSASQGQLVIFAAAIMNTGSSLGIGWGVGVSSFFQVGTGTIQVFLTETFPTDTILGVTLPNYGVGAMPIGTTATTMRVSATDATSITFQALNSAGTLVDSHFFFVGAGTLPAA